MSTVPALLSRNLRNSLVNFETWGGLIVNVKAYGAIGDGVTDDTDAIQRAFTYAATLYGGDTSSGAGFIGWYVPEVVFPSGVYICGNITVPSHIRISCTGQAVIQSSTGTSAVPAGTFVNNQITNIKVMGLSFLYFATAFIIPTGNIDFSFITFEDCQVAKTNVFIDTVSYAQSRSTTFKMERCNVSYGVPTACKVYTDKASFKENWLSHSMNSIFMYLNSFATFRDNVWVPTNAGVSKAYIYFTATDSVRGLDFKGDRFGGEDGSCPIVVVGDVNIGNTSNVYRMQGISFDDCYLASNSTYNPDGITGIRACVILRPTLTPLNTINFVSFKNCAFLPDLTGGVVQTYNVSDITTLVDSDFTIDFDSASAASASKGFNIPTSANLAQYVNTPILHKKTSLISKGGGKVIVGNTATTGQKKASFKINRTYPAADHTPFTFLVTTIGQGDTSFPATNYAYMSVYILTISATNGATNYSHISWTKLHGTVGGASSGANADIPANGVFWGTGDTGSVDQNVSVSAAGNIFDVTLIYGTRVAIGNVYIQPLYDFSLLT